MNPSAVGDAWDCVVFKERPNGMLYSLSTPRRLEAPRRPGLPRQRGADAAGPAPIPAGVWTHLAATYDGSSLRLYVNGSQASTLAISGSLARTTDPLRIGGNSIWDEFFAGTIDDVQDLRPRALGRRDPGRHGDAGRQLSGDEGPAGRGVSCCRTRTARRSRGRDPRCRPRGSARHTVVLDSGARAASRPRTADESCDDHDRQVEPVRAGVAMRPATASVVDVAVLAENRDAEGADEGEVQSHGCDRKPATRLHGSK